MLTKEQRTYLRDLAKQVREISQHGIWEEKRRLWKKLNRLESERPMVMCIVTDELWPELIPGDTLKIEDPFFKEIEFELRKRIYRWKYIKDDIITNDKLYLPIDYAFTEWVENRRRPFAAGDPYKSDGKTAEAFHPCIFEYADWDRLVKKPELKYIDWAGTHKKAEMLGDTLGDLLEIVEGEPFFSSIDTRTKGWGMSGIDILCELRGLEQVFMDMVLAPDFVHHAMDTLMEGLGAYLDVLEQENLLRLNNNEFWKNTNTPLGSNGLGVSDELPGPDFDPEHVRARDLWGYFQAQEFSGVSPEMLDEFVLQHQKPLAARFAMIGFGCCESNDKKYGVIRNAFPNLRQVSVSHAAEPALAARELGADYSISWKPHCTIINDFDERYVRSYMEEGFQALAGCHFVCSLRDNLTLAGQNPDVMGRWTDIAMELAGGR